MRRHTTTAAPNALHDLLSVPVVGGLTASVRSTTIADANAALAAIFETCLPLLLNFYAAEKLLPTDYIDLERLVRVGLPALLAEWIVDLLNGVTGRLFRLELVEHVRGSMLALAHRLDPDPLRPGRRDDRQFTELLVALEDAILEFSLAILVTGPPPPPTTRPERKAARARRLSNWALIRERRKLPNSFADVCRLASNSDRTVRRIGKGSGADWLNGRLPDDSVVCQAIQSVLEFKIQK